MVSLLHKKKGKQESCSVAILLVVRGNGSISSFKSYIAFRAVFGQKACLF